MKILIVQETDWLKRNPAQQHHLADRLSVRGHEVRVIDFPLLWREDSDSGLVLHRKEFDGVYKTLKNARVKVIRPGIVRLPLLDMASILCTHQAEIKSQMKDFSPDVIMGFSILNSYLAMRIARKRHKPFVYYWLDALHTLVPVRLLQPLGKLLETDTLRRSDRVIVINDKLKDLVVSLGATPEHTYVQKAGLDLAAFVPTISKEEIRSRHGFGMDDTVLFFMGWLYHFSGLKEVCLELARTKSNLKLLIVGDGDAYKDLSEIIKTHGLEASIAMAGKKPYSEIPSYIAASDFCLLPAYNNEIMRDIVPIKMYEYLALSKPVIATRLPGVIKEFGMDNGVSYIDKSEDVIEKAVELGRGNTRQELARKARQFAEKHSWDKVTDELEQILAEAIAAKKANPS